MEGIYCALKPTYIRQTRPCDYLPLNIFSCVSRINIGFIALVTQLHELLQSYLHIVTGLGPETNLEEICAGVYSMLISNCLSQALQIRGTGYQKLQTICVTT